MPQLLFTYIVMFPYCSRQEFVSDQCPDLTREVYLQDIHCVGSLCKLYFRELPNPLLTYELYKKFTVRCFALLIPLQQCGCAAGSSMTVVWDLVQYAGFWCISLNKLFSVLFPSCLALAIPVLVSFPHFISLLLFVCLFFLSFSAVSSPSSCSFFHHIASLLLLFLPTVYLLPELLILFLFLITVHHWEYSGSPGACDHNHKAAVSSSLSLQQSLTPAQTDCSAHV